MADICFASFRFDVTNQQLWNGGKAVSLRPQSLIVLHYLIEHREQFISTRELLSACWQDVQVGASNVKVCIKEIRQAFGETAATPVCIETKPRHGYRFIGTLTPQSCESDSPASPRFQNSVPQCVGRETELQALQARLEQALIGRRQIVFVTGEPGIGKITLVREFLRRVGRHDAPFVLFGQCREQYGIEETYQAIREGLDQLSKGSGGPKLLPFLRQHAPTWLAQLPSLLSPAERITLQQELVGATGQRMLREFTNAVELLGTDRGLILVLEDLHWADVSTLHLISALAQRRDPARLLIIGTFRPMELQRNGHPLSQMTAELFLHATAQEISLHFLTETATAEYLETRITTTSTAWRKSVTL